SRRGRRSALPAGRPGSADRCTSRRRGLVGETWFPHVVATLAAMASTEHASYEHLEYDTPLFRTAIAQFDQAVPYAEVDDGVAERLRHPERSIIVACPIKLDDGRRVVLPG